MLFLFFCILYSGYSSGYNTSTLDKSIRNICNKSKITIFIHLYVIAST